MPTSRSKSKIVTPMLTAEITILFIIENSGLSVLMIIVHKAPNQMYATTNTAEVTNLKLAVAELMVLKMAWDCADKALADPEG